MREYARPHTLVYDGHHYRWDGSRWVHASTGQPASVRLTARLDELAVLEAESIWRERYAHEAAIRPPV